MSDQAELTALEAALDAALLDDGDALTSDQVDRLFALRHAKADAERSASEKPPARGAARIAQALLARDATS